MYQLWTERKKDVWVYSTKRVEGTRQPDEAFSVSKRKWNGRPTFAYLNRQFGNIILLEITNKYTYKIP